MLPLHDMPVDQVPRDRSPSRAPNKIRKSAKKLTSFATALSDEKSVLFLDVETTGLSWFYDDITIVGWAIDGRYNLHIAGDDPRPLVEALKAAQALVTFNGTLFDLRFVKKSFGDIHLPPVHIDLRYLAKRVGLTGGQKLIEKTLGLQRIGMDDMGGAEAVLLWHRYLRGDDEALARLVGYNRYDVIGMCGILDAVMDRLGEHGDLLFTRPKFAERPYPLKFRPPARRNRKNDGRWKATPTFRGMFRQTPAEKATVVGIDLTGSEARPSGWCLLRGSAAETTMLASDDEIFARTMATRPTLISIDSPLSLPFGRTRVEDDDPGRQQYGIMRQCERQLKRRGVNVYPCLLPSMQRLTSRGMRLAARFRAEGVPVIESYPGAAQDIMGIPRKGAGIEFLRQGLFDFGIRGEFADGSATHDELDAITSAIVGSFFLSDKYEALQGPSEDALIIPDLKAGERKGMVIGVSGRICAGKTTTARILEELGFVYTRFSLVIDDEIKSRGLPLDRSTRQAVGLEIHREKGQRWLCEKVVERVAGHEHIVVDGLRFPEDHAFFIERFGSDFVHLHIQTSEALRASRYRKDTDGVAFEMADRQPVEAEIGSLAALANAVLTNDGSQAEHRQNVTSCLKLISQEKGRECLSQLL